MFAIYSQFHVGLDLVGWQDDRSNNYRDPRYVLLRPFRQESWGT